MCNGSVPKDDGTQFTIGDCVNEVDYYTNLYCPFAKCVVDGGIAGTYGGCGCTFYEMSCDMYKDHPEYKVSKATVRDIKLSIRKTSSISQPK